MSIKNLQKKSGNFKKKFFVASLHLTLALSLVILTPLFLSEYYQSTIDSFRQKELSDQDQGQIESFKGRVLEVLEERESVDVFSGNNIAYQVVKVEFLEGSLENQIRELNFPLSITNRDRERLLSGDLVVVSNIPTLNRVESDQNGLLQESGLEDSLDNNSITETLNSNFEISPITPTDIPENNENLKLTGRYRLNNIFWLVGIFLIIILILAGINGLTATLSVIFSLTVLIQFLIPQILNGGNIIWITFLVSVIIGLVSLFLSHGFSKRILVSSLAMLITLIISTFFADFAVNFTSLTGFSSDEVFALQTSGVSGNINFQGLLLAGIIIGSIGVLDDVIVAQATAIEEISSANPKLEFLDLVKKGFRIGREHIISMVNSLAFAYVGSSLPILLLFALYNTTNPWLTVNQEIISEEIVRTIVGSITLFLAVPITTLLSSRFLKQSVKVEIKN